MAYEVVKTVKGHQYRYLVEGYREGGKVKQRILKSFGRVDQPRYEYYLPVKQDKGIHLFECLIGRRIKVVLSDEDMKLLSEEQKALLEKRSRRHEK